MLILNEFYKRYEMFYESGPEEDLSNDGIGELFYSVLTQHSPPCQRRLYRPSPQFHPSLPYTPRSHRCRVEARRRAIDPSAGHESAARGRVRELHRAE